MSSEWGLGDTAGILIVAGALFVAAFFLPGVLRTVAAVLGVAVLGLWVFNFFVQGYAEAATED